MALSKSMTSDLKAMPIHFKSIVIKRSALNSLDVDERSGVLARAQRSDCEHLLALSCMSMMDVDHVLSQLERVGLRPGTDLAVCDMHNGPLITCDGIRFADEGQLFLPSWQAYYDPKHSSHDPQGEVTAEPVFTVGAASRSVPPEGPLRRVVFRGGGPVHWIGGDADDA